MARWDFDLDQIRRNWEQGPATPEVVIDRPAPTMAVMAVPEAITEKFCPGCGTELAGGGAPPATSAAAAATSAASDGVGSLRATVASRFGRVGVPLDPYPEAQALLARVRTLANRQLAPQEPLLAHFFDQTGGIIQRLAAKPGEGEKPPDKDKLRQELDRALGDLEDMVALWSGVGR
jgi:hypothetical protein